MNEDVVVVLSYHGREDTEACVDSLVTGSPEATVLVVDNGSHDGVLDSVGARWPGVHTLQNPENLGFAGGMNSGIRWALARDAGTVTVLNNDTVVPPGAIAALSTIARTGVAVSPEVRYMKRPGEVWFGGGTIDEDTGLARHLSEAETAAICLEDGLRPSETLAGCCVTARSGVWRTVGLFDERYFLNFEDSDWSVRAVRAGVPLVVDTRVHIEHKVSASFTGSYSYLGLFYYVRNALLFVRGTLGGSWSQVVRLLRRHVVPALVSHLREGERRELGRRLVVVGAAFVSYATGRLGRAPRWLERRAQGWVSR